MALRELKGTYTALVSPFDKSNAIDLKALKKLINFQVANGVSGIVVCGSTGESATLSLREKQLLIQKAVEYASGRISVIAGTGSNETQSAIALSKFAFEHGADAVLLVAPYYNKPTQRALIEHFGIIAKEVPIPQIIYNIPSRTGINILPDTLLKIAENKNVIGVKESSGNLEQMMQIIKNAPPHFTLLSGDDILTLPIISIGGKGVVSVISNYLPKEFSQLVASALDGNYKIALKIHFDLIELMQLNFIESNPTPTKYILSILGYIEEVCRMPLLPIEIGNRKKITTALKKAKIIS